MGTRGLTAVIMNGTHRVAQYGQWDHYPSGQGVTALKFCRENLTTPEGLEKFKAAVAKTRFLTDDEITELWAKDGVDLEACRGLVACDKADKFGKKYPSLDRDTGAEILELVLNGETQLQDSMDFIYDSLFCEGAYIVNLDTGKLETYNGFQKSPHNAGRYANVPKSKQKENSGYYGSALTAEFAFENLPTDDEFVAQLTQDDEE
jgi:hypothetical protein